MELYLSTWTEVEAYLGRGNLLGIKSLIIPVGSTEQHGPTGLIGTDFLSAWEISKKIGHDTQTLVAPPVCYGMAEHHMAFPGTCSLRPSIFISMMVEILSHFAQHGFEEFILINGHGGNISPLNSSFSEVLMDHPNLEFKLFNWWHAEDVQKYEATHFKDENGFHATCGEISVTMWTHPGAFQTQREYKHFDTAKQYPWPLSPAQFRKTFPDGRMASNPTLSSREHGRLIFEIAVESIRKEVLRRNNVKV